MPPPPLKYLPEPDLQQCGHLQQLSPLSLLTADTEKQWEPLAHAVVSQIQ